MDYALHGRSGPGFEQQGGWLSQMEPHPVFADLVLEVPLNVLGHDDQEGQRN